MLHQLNFAISKLKADGFFDEERDYRAELHQFNQELEQSWKKTIKQYVHLNVRDKTPGKAHLHNSNDLNYYLTAYSLCNDTYRIADPKILIYLSYY